MRKKVGDLIDPALKEAGRGVVRRGHDLLRGCSRSR